MFIWIRTVTMKIEMKKSGFLVVALLCVSMIASGCAAIVAGAGVGAGAYTYAKGELSRTYQAGYDKTLEASTATLKKLKMDVATEMSDGINTTLKAKRADGTPVTVKVVMLAPNVTKVGVRCGMIGLWDQKVSKLIHDHIDQRLQ